MPPKPISPAKKMKRIKRRKKSTTLHTQQESAQEDGARASIIDLPVQILMDIQSRLSVKSIFRCRSVCKLWLSILLTPDFAKLHFSRAPTCPLLYNPNGKRISKALYLVEIERDRLCYVCDDENRRSTKMCGCCRNREMEGHVNMKISTRFMLPNLESSSDVKLKDRSFNVVNSCNGLLCLRSKEGIMIYNPVTGEYSVLPDPGEDEFTRNVTVGGLGLCPKTNQYKVLVMLYKRMLNPSKREYFDSNEALVYTLGLGTWRRIGYAPRSLRSLSVPTFLDGALHWFVGNGQRDNLIVYFHFDDEQFRAVPPPHPLCYNFEPKRVDEVLQDKDPHWRSFFPRVINISMGVLRGQIFVYDTFSCGSICLWVMKDYGVQESWFEEYHGWPAGLNLPIDFLKNGDLLMYFENNTLFSYAAFGCCCRRYFKISGYRSKFQVIPHIPSFHSLKEVMGDNVEVLNLRSRLTSSELHEGKTKPLLLVEDERDCMFDEFC